MDTMRYTSERNSKTLEIFREMRHRSELLDGKLVAGGKGVDVHLSFLAANSDYLRREFTKRFSENIRVFEFDNITYFGLSMVIDFIYKREVTLNASTFPYVLDAATCLEIEELISFCNDFSKHRPELFLTKMNIAEKYSSSFLSDSVLETAKLYEIVDILSSDNFRPRLGSERRTVSHVLKWMQYHKDSWKSLPQNIIKDMQEHMLSQDVVRYGLLSEQDMLNIVEDVSRASPEVLASAIYQGTAYHNTDRSHPFVRGNINRCRKPDIRVLLICGTNGRDCSNSVYESSVTSNGIGKWRDDIVKPLKETLAGFAVAVVGNFVFVSGGENCHKGSGINAKKTMFRLNPFTNTWKDCADMSQARSYFTLNNFQNDEELVAIGGIQKRQALSEVEIYQIISDSWENATPMPANTSGHAAVTIDNRIYVFGGKDEEGTVLDSVWRFERDPRRQFELGNWSKLGRMPTPRTGHAVSVYGESVFVYGGTKVVNRISKNVNSFHSFSTQTGSWTELTSPPVPRAYATSFVCDDKFFILGGLSLEELATSDEVQMFSILDKTWSKQTSRLPRKLAKGHCVILKPPQPRNQRSHKECAECSKIIYAMEQANITVHVTETKAPNTIPPNICDSAIPSGAAVEAVEHSDLSSIPRDAQDMSIPSGVHADTDLTDLKCFHGSEISLHSDPPLGPPSFLSLPPSEVTGSASLDSLLPKQVESATEIPDTVKKEPLLTPEIPYNQPQRRTVADTDENVEGTAEGAYAVQSIHHAYSSSCIDSGDQSQQQKIFARSMSVPAKEITGAMESMNFSPETNQALYLKLPILDDDPFAGILPSPSCKEDFEKDLAKEYRKVQTIHRSVSLPQDNLVPSNMSDLSVSEHNAWESSDILGDFELIGLSSRFPSVREQNQRTPDSD